jgi:hypothetical protein
MNKNVEIPVQKMNFFSIFGFSGDPESSPSIFTDLDLFTSIGNIAKKTTHHMII